ncbi:MAG: hypothetical protein HC923_07005, partial [Myxococcales bacterium]|nr:hypothetical protein [Myxococcales bacterium]
MATVGDLRVRATAAAQSHAAERWLFWSAPSRARFEARWSMGTAKVRLPEQEIELQVPGRLTGDVDLLPFPHFEALEAEVHPARSATVTASLRGAVTGPVALRASFRSDRLESLSALVPRSAGLTELDGEASADLLVSLDALDQPLVLTNLRSASLAWSGVRFALTDGTRGEGISGTASLRKEVEGFVSAAEISARSIAGRSSYTLEEARARGAMTISSQGASLELTLSAERGKSGPMDLSSSALRLNAHANEREGLRLEALRADLPSAGRVGQRSGEPLARDARGVGPVPRP